MKLVLHVGLPKTGTTSFQDYMVQKYSTPIDNTWYPPLGQTSSAPMHLVLGQSLRNGDLSALEQTFRSFEGEAERLILSDENIYVEMPALSASTQTAFRNIMARHDVTVVSIIRDPTRWKRSFYIQSLELRRSKTDLPHATANSMWQTPLKYADFFAAPYPMQICETADLLDKIADMSSAQNVITLKYEDNLDVVDMLRSALDLRQDPALNRHRRNPSLSDVQAEILRQANGQRPLHARMVRALIAIDNGTPPRRKIRENLLGWRNEYDWSALSYTPNPPLRYTFAEFEAKIDTLKIHAANLT